MKNEPHPAFVEDRRILQQLKASNFSPLHIFDVGASIGVWSSVASKVFPEASYDLFEPLAELQEDYRKAYLPTGFMHSFLQEPDHRLHAIALGKIHGNIPIYVHPNLPGSTTLAIGKVHKNTPHPCIDVPITTIDQLIKDSTLPKPDLLKMDVQGSEMEILQGAVETLPYVSVIMAECWLIRTYAFLTPLLSEVVDFLKPFGFEIYDFGTQYRNAEGRLVSIDPCFVNTNMPCFKANFKNMRGTV